MTNDISFVPGPVRAVPRAGVPFAPVSPAAPSRCPASRPLPPPPDVRLPVMTVGGERPDRTGNVDLTPFLRAVGAGKADKVANATPGHLASLDAAGNLVDSGKDPSELARKLDMDSTFPEWLASPPSPYQGGALVSHNGRIWRLGNGYSGTGSEPGVSEEWEDVLLQYLLDLKQGSLSSAQMAAANSGITAALVAAYNGYAAQIAGKADAAGLRYRIVVPGEWEFSDVSPGISNISTPVFVSTGEPYAWTATFSYDGVTRPADAWGSREDDLTVVFTYNDEGLNLSFTATRPSLPGHLLDRASNRVTPADASALTLTLPAAVPGYMRDLIVRLNLTALATAPEVTFVAPTGETVTFEAEDGAMPELEAGEVNLVSFSETAPGVIDVAYKTMQEVA